MTAAFDVLIVGGGAAGLRAAIAVAETDPALRIAVVSKVYPMRSHTVSAEGGAAGVIASARHPASSFDSSTGAARGAASPTATSPYAPLAA